jgi:hypothetical protein
MEHRLSIHPSEWWNRVRWALSFAFLLTIQNGVTKSIPSKDCEHCACPAVSVPVRRTPTQTEKGSSLQHAVSTKCVELSPALSAPPTEWLHFLDSHHCACPAVSVSPLHLDHSVKTSRRERTFPIGNSDKIKETAPVFPRLPHFSTFSSCK